MITSLSLHSSLLYFYGNLKKIFGHLITLFISVFYFYFAALIGVRIFSDFSNWFGDLPLWEQAISAFGIINLVLLFLACGFMTLAIGFYPYLKKWICKSTFFNNLVVGFRWEIGFVFRISSMRKDLLSYK